MNEIVFGLVGGLGLFIFGMKYLSDGLQKVAGSKLRRVLRSLTQNRFRGVMLGTVVTSIVQSSSVTTVMLVGLINAGIISLMQAASVEIGANIGTTITAQIIAFKISQYSLPAIALGVIIMLASRRKKTQFWGQVVLSFGFIFLGLSTMSDVMKPLKEIQEVTDFFVKLSENPFLAIMLGVIFTVLIQSSSASIGMVMALAGVGLIDFRASLFLVLGDNIGTTVTAWLASIGGTTSAKRMACFHSANKILGVSYFVFFINSGIFIEFVDYITPGAITTETIGRHIANAHTCFNVFNGLVFMVIMGPVVKLTRWIIPGKDIYVSSEMKYLQDKLISTPEVAIESAKKELLFMSQLVHKTVRTAIDGFFAMDRKSIPHVRTQEQASDHLQHDITFYLAKLAMERLSPEISGQLPPLLHSINDMERIADHAINVAELTERVDSGQLVFSGKAQEEMRAIYEKMEEMFQEILRILEFGEIDTVDRVMKCEAEINKMQRQYLADHSQRLCARVCEPHSALVFVDYINNLEKIADHLTNVAQAAGSGFSFEGISEVSAGVGESTQV